MQIQFLLSIFFQLLELSLILCSTSCYLLYSFLNSLFEFFYPHFNSLRRILRTKFASHEFVKCKSRLRGWGDASPTRLIKYWNFMHFAQFLLMFLQNHALCPDLWRTSPALRNSLGSFNNYVTLRMSRHYLINIFLVLQCKTEHNIKM